MLGYDNGALPAVIATCLETEDLGLAIDRRLDP